MLSWYETQERNLQLQGYVSTSVLFWQENISLLGKPTSIRLSYKCYHDEQTGFYLPIWKRSWASISSAFVADALQSFSAVSKCLRACNHCSGSSLSGVQATLSANVFPKEKQIDIS